MWQKHGVRHVKNGGSSRAGRGNGCKRQFGGNSCVSFGGVRFWERWRNEMVEEGGVCTTGEKVQLGETEEIGETLINCG